MKCEGYSVTAARQGGLPRAIAQRQVVLQTNLRQKQVVPQPWMGKLDPGSGLHFEQSFQDFREEQYFRLFCDETSTAISGGFESPL